MPHREGLENGIVPERQECPEFVYFNFPAIYGSLVLTAPNKFIDLKSNPDASPQTGELSIKVKNNDLWNVSEDMSAVNLVERLKNFLPQSGYEVLVSNPQRLESLTKVDLLKFIQALLPDELPEDCEQLLQSFLNSKKRLDFKPAAAAPEIIGCYYKNEYIPIEEIESMKEKYEKDMEVFGRLSHVKKGDYLYRAIDKRELAEILKDNTYLIRKETNFEDFVGPQVADFASDSEYAGVVIRLKVSGNYFQNKGQPSSPRVTSIVPHFAEVEIMQGEKWISIDEYKIAQKVS